MTSSLSLPHTAYSRSQRATPNPARSCIMEIFQEWGTASSLTACIHSRFVDAEGFRTDQCLLLKPWMLMMILGCISQFNEAVEVDGEVASILTHSRFGKKFTFQPPGGASESPGVHTKASVTTQVGYRSVFV